MHKMKTSDSQEILFLLIYYSPIPLQSIPVPFLQTKHGEWWRPASQGLLSCYSSRWVFWFLPSRDRRDDKCSLRCPRAVMNMNILIVKIVKMNSAPGDQSGAGWRRSGRAAGWLRLCLCPPTSKSLSFVDLPGFIFGKPWTFCQL